MTTDTSWVVLRDAEPGVHETRDGTLLFKSEYQSPQGHTRAFVLSSGEAWWGGHGQDHHARETEVVRAVDVYALLNRKEPGL